MRVWGGMATLGLKLGSPRALAVTWTGEQPLAPTTASRAPRVLQLGYSSRLGWPWEKGGVGLGTPLPAPGWDPWQCQAGVVTGSSHSSWCQSCVQPRMGSSHGMEQNPWHQPHPTWVLSVQCPSSPYTAARTGAGAQGGHFSPQGLVYRPQKEPALNSRFRSAPLTSISFRKLELHNYPKPRMNLKRNKTKKQTNKNQNRTKNHERAPLPPPPQYVSLAAIT